MPRPRPERRDPSAGAPAQAGARGAGGTHLKSPHGNGNMMQRIIATDAWWWMGCRAWAEHFACGV